MNEMKDWNRSNEEERKLVYGMNEREDRERTWELELEVTREMKWFYFLELKWLVVLEYAE
jgi:hypothetical protein